MKYSLIMSGLLAASLLISCKAKNKEQEPSEKPPIAVDVVIAGSENISVSWKSMAASFPTKWWNFVPK